MEIRIRNTCIWCEENEVSVDKMICSMKCLNEMAKSAKEQGVKSHYTKDDVDIKHKLGGGVMTLYSKLEKEKMFHRHNFIYPISHKEQEPMVVSGYGLTEYEILFCVDCGKIVWRITKDISPQYPNLNKNKWYG